MTATIWFTWSAVASTTCRSVIQSSRSHLEGHLEGSSQRVVGKVTWRSGGGQRLFGSLDHAKQRRGELTVVLDQAQMAAVRHLDQFGAGHPPDDLLGMRERGQMVLVAADHHALHLLQRLQGLELVVHGEDRV